MTASIWEPGVELTVETNSIVDETTNIAADGDTVVNFATFSYTPGAGLLKVYVNGVRQIPVTDYEETSSTSITFLSGLDAGDRVYVEANVSVDVTVVAEAVTLVDNIKVDGNNLSIFGDLPIGSVGFSGSNNIGIGVGTFSASATTATGNVILGRDAGSAITTGYSNVLIGYNTLPTIANAASTTVIGSNTGVALTSIQDSTMLGSGSAAADATIPYTSTNDTFIGTNVGTVANSPAGSSMASSGNVYIGMSSGRVNSMGVTSWNRTNNVYIGTDAGDNYSNATVENSIAIGYGATVTASNQAVFGNSSITDTRLFGNVGINCTPSVRLQTYEALTSSWINTSDTGTVIGGSTYSGAAAANTSAISMRRYRGSVASPSAVTSGDRMGIMSFQAWGGTTLRTLAAVQSYVDTYVSDSNISSFIIFGTSSSGSAAHTEKGRILANGDWYFGGVATAHSFEVIKAAGTVVNRLSATGSATTAAPSLSSVGSDTNIDLKLIPKGTGVVQYGTHTGSADAPISGYITIKDSAGNTRKLAVIT